MGARRLGTSHRSTAIWIAMWVAIWLAVGLVAVALIAWRLLGLTGRERPRTASELITPREISRRLEGTASRVLSAGRRWSPRAATRAVHPRRAR